MTNPYAAPETAISDLSMEGDETYEPKMFSTQGRIGRLRYMAYSTGTTMLLAFALGIVSAILTPILVHNRATGAAGGVMVIVVGLFYIPMIAFAFIMMRRRLNDLDRSGWLSLLMLIPLVNFFFSLYLMCASGTQGPNSYGPMPCKNSWGIILGGLVLPLVAIIGILAAVALPAYQSYVMKAKAAAVHQAQ
jgi:uncharacterized membrane protein YhaH (DUF805 family)